MDDGAFPVVLAGPLAAADELGGAVSAERAAEEQEVRPSEMKHSVAAAVRQARR